MKGRIGLRITSSILFVFSLILFLSGCLLQRKSMHTLERYYDQIPLPDTHPLVLGRNRQGAKAPTSNIGNGNRDGNGHPKRPRYGDQQRLMSSPSTEYRSWGEVEHALERKRIAQKLRTVAYVQMVESLDEVCGAVMAFGDLDRLGSRAARVLVYPEDWDMELDDAAANAITPEDAFETEQEMAQKEFEKKLSARRRKGKNRQRKTKVTKSQEQSVISEADPPPLTHKPSTAVKSTFRTARRLLYLAQKRYHAYLLPLPESEITPLTVFNMTGYKRALYLSNPAQILKNMDDLLLHTPPAPLVAPRGSSVSTSSSAEDN
ncbi:hypothetical protein ABW21_db0202556 [Orbilia brochopaga]|nr:hypothetical protein ABW21_db0202556 [Drechslerella brochopaga]